jgi:hypothetical protein
VLSVILVPHKVTTQESPTDTLREVAVTLFILALQSVLHFLKLAGRSIANAWLTGDGRTPELKLIVVFIFSGGAAQHPKLFLFFLIRFFFSGCLSLCSLFVFVFFFSNASFSLSKSDGPQAERTIERASATTAHFAALTAFSFLGKIARATHRPAYFGIYSVL